MPKESLIASLAVAIRQRVAVKTTMVPWTTGLQLYGNVLDSMGPAKCTLGSGKLLRLLHHDLRRLSRDAKGAAQPCVQTMRVIQYPARLKMDGARSWLTITHLLKQ